MVYKLNKYKDYYGLGMICAGVFLQFISFLSEWTIHNIVLFSGMFLVFGGVIVYYRILKNKGKYQENDDTHNKGHETIG